MAGERGGLNGWTMVSRTRYGLVRTAINFTVVVGLSLVFGSLSQRALWFLIPGVFISFFVHGWVWYPREQQKLAARSCNQI